MKNISSLYCLNLGFSPLGRPGNRHGIKNLWDEPQIQELAKKYNKSPANIACRYIVRNPSIILT